MASKIKLVLKRSNDGIATPPSSTPPANSRKATSKTAVKRDGEASTPSGQYSYQLPPEPSLQKARELVDQYGEGQSPFTYDAKKKQSVPNPGQISFAVTRCLSKDTATTRLQLNRDAARNQPGKLQGNFATRETVLLKEYELCMAKEVMEKSEQSQTVPDFCVSQCETTNTPSSSSRRKAPQRKAKAAATPRTAEASSSLRSVAGVSA